MSTSTASVIDFEQTTPATDSSPLVVILASGPEDGGTRATLALTAAVTSISMDTPTRLFLAGDGAHWAYEGHAEDVHVNGFPPLIELIETFAELGGESWICSTCDKFCGIPGDSAHSDRVRRRDVQPRGMAAVLPDLARGSSVTF
jgi:predicted peroxiredoxin